MRNKSKLKIVTFVLGMIFVLSTMNNNSIINNQQNKENVLELISSEYQVAGEGGKLNVTLHQSYLSTTPKEFLNLSDSNTFTLPCPIEPTFNSSFITLDFDNIQAPNKNLLIETGTSGQANIFGGENYFSFQVRDDCILDNFSICFGENHPSPTNNASIMLEILNAQWKNNQIEPGVVALDTYYDTIMNGSIRAWHNYTSLNLNLPTSQTTNNTFFIRVFQTTFSATAWGLYYYENNGLIDDSIVYKDITGFLQLQTRDPSLKVGLFPLNNAPKPSQINLKINNNTVNDNLGNSGYWISTEVYSSPSGQLEFGLSADWWDVSCSIIKAQVNYTKTDLKATSMFNVLGGGQDVQWNVSRSEGLNFFDTRLSNYRINFTIPSSWNNIQVFNGPIDKTNDISINPEKKGYKTVHVANAGNGTYWHLTATSENLLTSIDTYVDTNPTSIVWYSDIVQFNTTFMETISQNDGVINLSVYSPSAINNKLNFASFNSTFNSGTEFYLGSWDVSDTVTQYGEFRVQVSWSNNTAAGFNEEILTIIGETDLALITPSQDATFYTDQFFDIIVYFEDFNLLTSIDGATVEYNIDGQGLQSTTENNGTIGYYVIPVDCSVFTSDGLKSVDISANKQYYDSQLLTYSFNVIVVEEPSRASQPAIPGYNIIALIGLCFGITIALIKNKYKK